MPTSAWSSSPTRTTARPRRTTACSGTSRSCRANRPACAARPARTSAVARISPTRRRAIPTGSRLRGALLDLRGQNRRLPQCPGTPDTDRHLAANQLQPAAEHQAAWPRKSRALKAYPDDQIVVAGIFGWPLDDADMASATYKIAPVSQSQHRRHRASDGLRPVAGLLRPEPPAVGRNRGSYDRLRPHRRGLGRGAGLAACRLRRRVRRQRPEAQHLPDRTSRTQ